jgi:thioredoxin-dependent peroxiredoxin
MTERLETGAPAPEFTLLDDSGTEVSLADFRGERTVVYFYPAAMTRGCTTQACDFRDSIEDFDGASVRVVGVSPDAPERLAKFREKEKLPFTLLSDPDFAAAKAYGAYGEKTLYGRKSTGILRSTIVLAADGSVERADYNVKATGHVARLRQEMGI